MSDATATTTTTKSTTKSTTTTKRSSKKQIDFIVTTSNPNDASNAANKKRVRSVAALKSWPERRKKIFEQLERSGSGHGAFLLDQPDHQPRRRCASSAKQAPPSSKPSTTPPSSKPSTTPPSASVAKRPRVYGPPRPGAAPAPTTASARGSAADPNPPAQAVVPKTASSAARLSSQVSTAVEPRSEAIGSSMELYRRAFALLAHRAGEHHLDPPDPLCPGQSCRGRRRTVHTPLGAVSSSQPVLPARSKRMADGSEKRMECSGNVAMITPPSSPGPSPSRGKVDPFNLYPVQYQPWFDLILHHMITVYAPRGWPALKISDDQGVKWEWFMTQNSLSDPALFYVRLLFGSGDMIRLGSMRPEIMFWLRQEAIKAINDALSDPKRSCSDALILAVGRIALHEHMYGDKYASSRVHRPAQKRMIEMRGGMRSLEFPELVKRLMRWSDRIMAVGSGTPRMLEDDDANPNFTLKQSVGAIERWAPQEVPGVRSKIKISDLVNDDDENDE